MEKMILRVNKSSNYSRLNGNVFSVFDRNVNARGEKRITLWIEHHGVDFYSNERIKEVLPFSNPRENIRKVQIKKKMKSLS